MSKLLRANFVRLFESRIFWECMTFIFGIAFFLLWLESVSMDIETVLLQGTIYISIAILIFVGIFIGTEYSDGTIRNKLIVGHSKLSVYLANLIVCVAVSVIMYFVYIVTVVCVSLAWGWKFAVSADVLFLSILYNFAIAITFTSLFLMVRMLVCSKAEGLVLLVVILVLLFIAAFKIQGILDAPKYYMVSAEYYIDESGEEQFELGHEEKNPNYISGTKRKVYKFFYDFLPSCQILQTQEFLDYRISEQLVEGVEDAKDSFSNIERLPLYSLLITIVTTACGNFFFSRKDLK